MSDAREIVARLRRWLWGWLIRLAQRVWPDGTFRCTGWTYTFERNVGVVFHEDGRRGTRIWYMDEDHDKAWNEGIGADVSEAES